ncbi:hypothetical protein EVAR_89851_1 [Eumeta japonica]|uniref:Uncharacterized protein n=1 Tax=Eumeta variegata TaxID=151549 RepID=A0A4C1ZV66_EUMVA|nr:hypothetical protein EVAR_89851_1 [Eumeta japonica]
MSGYTQRQCATHARRIDTSHRHRLGNRSAGFQSTPRVRRRTLCFAARNPLVINESYTVRAPPSAGKAGVVVRSSDTRRTQNDVITKKKHPLLINSIIRSRSDKTTARATADIKALRARSPSARILLFQRRSPATILQLSKCEPLGVSCGRNYSGVLLKCPFDATSPGVVACANREGA